jgi:hypothetical protein
MILIYRNLQSIQEKSEKKVKINIKKKLDKPSLPMIANGLWDRHQQVKYNCEALELARAVLAIITDGGGGGQRLVVPSATYI